MERETFYIVAAIGVIIYGSLYLTGVFVAAVVLHKIDAGLLALATAGITYTSFMAHFVRVRWLANGLATLSIMCGAVSGAWLIG